APSAPPVQQGEAVEGKRDIIGKTIRVEQETVDKLMSLAGELLVAKNSLPYLAEEIVSMDGERAKKAILEKSFLIGRLSDQLQDLVMGMRMLPISYVFDRYPKLVRDISKKLGKKVHLEQEGAETKLDKNIIEMLADPLVHIVRNSLDHGIETPSERVAMGKKETGELIMRAFNQSDRVVIEIIDDGRGIDTSRVVRKVLEKGLMTLEQIEALSEEARVELVMLPGLSTAEQISEYSGRGVGMDVVKKSIESFGGTVRIESRVGIGTKITMTIPVSLAVTTLLHVSMRGVHYGFPMDFVKETVKIARDGIVTIHNRPAINIRGEVMPLLFVPSMLDIEGISEELPIVILNIKGNLVGMVVNQLLGQIDVVQKPLDGILSGHPLLSGTALLGNGQIILIVDPIRLFSIKEQIALKEVSL
ncbi:MAG: chemotaxis protein CheA, partial [Campylobacterales bacterium]